MKYKKVVSGVFLNRPNRFIANVLIDGEAVVCHVKNTGRCAELLKEGAKVFLEESDNLARKTKYDLVAVYKGDVLYNIDSQAPNKVFGEYIDKLLKNVTYVKCECKYKNSRFDFYVEYDNKKAFIEVKGVTLEKDNVMLFPDAPTIRGTKHLKELKECISDGYEAYVVFVIQADAGDYFIPNKQQDKEFARALCDSVKNGVKAMAFTCNVEKDFIEIKKPLEVKMVHP